ncbi:MAG: C39 family peptidase [Coraliomargaritaceae bacterium]
MRIWTSHDGRTMEARLIDASDLESLHFELKNGTKAKISISRLSEADADLVKVAHASKNTASLDQPKQSPDPEELPRKHNLDDVPMVVQYGKFCVPASAAMIANYHDLDVDQYEIAQLSSSSSINNEGTYPRDMKLAMEKLGFEGEEIGWENSKQFADTILPRMKQELYQDRPIYISFKSGVFGPMGHGCVVVGYNERKEELYFHNPWGEKFEMEYSFVAGVARGIVTIKPVQAVRPASPEELEAFTGKIPKLEGGFNWLYSQILSHDIPSTIKWCNRYDTLSDRKFADDTARKEGRTMLKLAFRRNPAVLIPNSPKGRTQSWYLVTRPPEGGAQYSVQELRLDGWSQPELKTLGSLTREWPTLLASSSGESYWRLPLVELFMEP